MPESRFPGESGLKEKIGVAVIGLGIGEQHARTYAALGNCTIRWLYDLDPSRASSLAEELEAESVAGNLEDVLGDPQTQVLSIASYDDAHSQQVLSALEAGKHVFVEKPLCLSFDDLKSIKEAWSRQGGRLKLSSNLVLRGAPLYRELKRMLGRGDMGQVYAFYGDYLYGRLHKITDGWRACIPDYSVVLGGGVHLIDLMLWLTGQRPERVFAWGSRICTRDRISRFCDFVMATMGFPSGLIGSISANFGCVHRHQHVMRIFGERASFIYDDMGPRLHTSRDPAAAPEPMDFSPLPRHKGALIRDFIEAVARDSDMSAQTQHEFDVISTCLAAERSRAAREEVEVEYV